MLGEFLTSADKCKDLLQKAIDLANNTGVDTIDLSELASSGDEIAAAAFLLNKKIRPTQIISRKDAYDFVTAHDRLQRTFSQDRAHYYATAGEELSKDRVRIDELKAILQRLDLFSEV